MRCGFEKVSVFDEQDSIATLDLQGNNILHRLMSKPSQSTRASCKVIDLRQNALLCGKIELSNIEVKSDCHSTATVKSKNYHHLMAAYIPQQFPLNVSTILRFHLFTTRNVVKVNHDSREY